MKIKLLLYLAPAVLLLLFFGFYVWSSFEINRARAQLVENGFSIGFNTGVSKPEDRHGLFINSIDKPKGEILDRPSNHLVSRLFPGASGNRIKVVEGSRMFGDKKDYRGFEDHDLKPLSKLAHVEELLLGWNSISDIGLANFAHFHELRHLELAGCDITDEGVVNLCRFRKLRHLDLGYTAITDAAIDMLPKLQELEILSLEDTGVTNNSISWIVSHENLKVLRLGHSKITQTSIEELGKLSKLEELLLDGTKINDLSNVLNHMPRLQLLSVDNTQIGDESLNALKGPMDYLSIANTDVSSNALTKILSLRIAGYFDGEGTGLSDEQIEEIEDRLE